MPTEPQNPPKSATWQALNLAWELGYLIVIPLVLFALGGRWIDRKFDTSPWFLLGGLLLSIVITTISLIRKFSSLIKDIEQQSKK